ncbi:hypothetical protein Hypma_005127 [Hypsizygus marmoreus]|uniref:DUF6699 domain-containing protein n=1 Tax=Hypsizygus marmoreus TaxID=39966 RepID=A0A369K2A0_HYPMA|nr:hypothetical protein Hypma_005127 [Hypsizygus marmoreus]
MHGTGDKITYLIGKHSLAWVLKCLFTSYSRPTGTLSRKIRAMASSILLFHESAPDWPANEPLDHAHLHRNGSSAITYTEIPEAQQRPAAWEDSWEAQNTQRQPTYVDAIGPDDSPPMRPIQLDDSPPPERILVLTVPSVLQLQPHDGPPPIDISRSIYQCVGLPEVVDEPVVLNQALEFTSASYDPHIIYAKRPQIDARNHVCEPATYPSLQSMVVIYPTGRPLTVVPADKERNEVTVGDVLRSIDKEYFKVWVKWAGRDMNPVFDVHGVPVCECLGILTALMHLRSLYEMGGLVRTAMGHDIWALKLGRPQ